MKTLAALTLLVPLAGAQTTWYVDVNGTPPGTGTLQDPYTSIQYALDQPSTVNFDKLQVAAGTYVENIRMNTKSVDLVGSGPGSCVIQAAGAGDVVTFDSNGSFRGFTVTGGLENGMDAGLHALGYMDLSDCVIADNEGLGVHWEYGSPYDLIINVTIANNGKKGLRMGTCAVATMRQTILWGNGGEPKLTEYCGHWSSTFSHNDIEGSNFPFGPGMFEADPIFRDPANGDYRLVPGSPCIDAGNPNGSLDPDGTVADVGAHTFDASLLVGESYCTAGLSASGCKARIVAHGTPSASASSGFTLSIVGMEGAKDGLFFYGTNGRQANPWGTGGSYVCVVPPRVRGGLLTASGSTAGACDGWFIQDMNARWCASCPKPAHNPGSGAVMQAQMWYRDPQNTGSTATSMSDAVEFTILP